MAELTPERLAELRRIAEAANTVEQLPLEERQLPENVWRCVTYGREFTPPTVLAMLDEIERLRRERETLAGVVGAVRQEEPWLRRLARVGRCSKCDGIGRVAYPSTTTWRGGIGGQMVTEDVCDRCWGSGDEERKGVDLRAMEAEIERLRRAVEAATRMAEILRGLEWSGWDERFRAHMCPVCGGYKSNNKHFPDCDLNKALSLL